MYAKDRAVRVVTLAMKHPVEPGNQIPKRIRILIGIRIFFRIQIIDQKIQIPPYRSQTAKKIRIPVGGIGPPLAPESACAIRQKCCQVAISIARFGQNWRNLTPFGDFKLYLAIFIIWWFIWRKSAFSYCNWIPALGCFEFFSRFLVQIAKKPAQKWQKMKSGKIHTLNYRFLFFWTWQHCATSGQVEYLCD